MSSRSSGMTMVNGDGVKGTTEESEQMMLRERWNYRGKKRALKSVSILSSARSCRGCSLTVRLPAVV